MTEILIARLPHGEGLPLPARATPGSAGFDLSSAEDGELAPMERRLFATGFAVAIPEGFEFQLRPRSGLALRHGLTLPNTPATIDSDYRGELKVALVNLGAEPCGSPGGCGSPRCCWPGWSRWPSGRSKRCPRRGGGRGDSGAPGTSSLTLRLVPIYGFR